MSLSPDEVRPIVLFEKVQEWGAEKGRKYYILKIHRVYNEKNMVN